MVILFTLLDRLAPCKEPRFMVGLLLLDCGLRLDPGGAGRSGVLLSIVEPSSEDNDATLA